MKTLWNYISKKPLTKQFEFVEFLRKQFPTVRAESLLETKIPSLQPEVIEQVNVFWKASYQDLVS